MAFMILALIRKLVGRFYNFPGFICLRVDMIMIAMSRNCFFVIGTYCNIYRRTIGSEFFDTPTQEVFCAYDNPIDAIVKPTNKHTLFMSRILIITGINTDSFIYPSVPFNKSADFQIEYNRWRNCNQCRNQN